MERQLKRYINTLVRSRVDEIMVEVSTKDRRYRELSRRVEKLQKNIMEKLPEGYSKDLLDYEDIEIQLLTIALYRIYRRGLMDGIKLSNTCRKVLKL